MSISSWKRTDPRHALRSREEFHKENAALSCSKDFVVDHFAFSDPLCAFEVKGDELLYMTSLPADRKACANHLARYCDTKAFANWLAAMYSSDLRDWLSKALEN